MRLVITHKCIEIKTRQPYNSTVANYKTEPSHSPTLPVQMVTIRTTYQQSDTEEKQRAVSIWT